MDALKILNMKAEEQGWTEATMLQVATDYINTKDSSDFEQYLKDRSDICLYDQLIDVADLINEKVVKYLEDLRAELSQNDIYVSKVARADFDGPAWVMRNDDVWVKFEVLDGGSVDGNPYIQSTNLQFCIDTKRSSGLLVPLYDIIPHNFTPDCWVSCDNQEELLDRLERILEIVPTAEVVENIKNSFIK